MQETFRDYGRSNFAVYLRNFVGRRVADELLQRYNVGTSPHWKGATVFWQTDIIGRICTGTVIPYKRKTGKRLKGKDGKSYVNWVHTQFDIPQGNYKTCLFGAHLLPKYPQKTVALVESEKTALIAAHHFPKFLWLACSGSNGLLERKFEALKGRKVLLIPDQGFYNKWVERSQQLNHICQIEVFPILERLKKIRPDLPSGFDIADVIPEVKTLLNLSKNQ
jgi:hypothetical protein